MPLENLFEYARNPRKNDDVVDKMVSCIKEFGFRIPIIAKSDGTVVDGHLRLKAARKMGLEEVPVINADDLTEAQIKAFRLIANRSANWAEWDEELLKLEFKELEDLDFDLELTGFDLDDIQRRLDELEAGEIVEDDLDESEMMADESEVITTKSRDLWVLGEHRLLCGDSTEIENVQKLMNGEKADMVFTDPPYNIASDSKNFSADYSNAMNDLMNNEWDKNFNVTNFLNTVYCALAENISVYICTSHFLAPQIWEWMKNWSDHYSYCVWSKPNPMPSLSKRHWTWNTELICYATRGKHTFNFPKEGHALSTWTINKRNGLTGHPTEKPIEVPITAISHSSNRNDVVLDCFGGSGSTLIACEQLNRRCFMMELSPKYCDVIIRRWQKLTGRAAVLEETGKTFDELFEKDDD